MVKITETIMELIKQRQALCDQLAVNWTLETVDADELGIEISALEAEY
jgi:hypothetical protein